MSSDFDAEARAWMLAEDREPLAALLQRAYDAGLRRGVEDAAETIERLIRARRWAGASSAAARVCIERIRALLDPKPDPDPDPDPDQGPGDPLASEMLRGSGEMRPFERGSRGSARGNDGTKPSDSDEDAGRAPEAPKPGFMTDDGDYFEHCCDVTDRLECDACAVLDCPHGEPLHFHGDGCPSCDGYAEGSES